MNVTWSVMLHILPLWLPNDGTETASQNKFSAFFPREMASIQHEINPPDHHKSPKVTWPSEPSGRHPSWISIWISEQRNRSLVDKLNFENQVFLFSVLSLVSLYGNMGSISRVGRQRDGRRDVNKVPYMKF